MIEVKGLTLFYSACCVSVKYKDVKIGQTAFAIGHPEGLVWTFTNGMVSQKRPEHVWRL